MCRDVADRLPEWAADRLPPAARARVEAHLAECAACRAEADAWRAAGAAARLDVAHRAAALELPRWHDPARRRAAVPVASTKAVLGSGSAITAGWRQAPLRRPRWTALGALGVAAAAVLFVLRAAPDLATMDDPRPHPSAADASDPRAAATIVARAPTAVRRRNRRSGPTTADGLVAASVAADRAAAPTSARADLARDGSPAAGPATDAPIAIAEAPGASAAAPTSARHRRPRDGGGRAEPSGVATAAATPNTPPATSPPEPASPEPDPPTAPPSPPTATVGPPVAIIAGTVSGPDGLPRAEVRIVARPMDDALAPVEGGTNGEGAYALTLPPGRWSVHTEAGAYLAAWPDDGVTPFDGPPTDAVAGGTTRIDFTLRTAPGGAIRGKVVDREGWPVPGALVVAAEPDRERGGYTHFVAATFTAADGTYALAVMSGGWLVAATADWRAPELVWWGGGDLITVDRTTGSRRTATEGIDFRLR